jgi:hypothetical protein
MSGFQGNKTSESAWNAAPSNSCLHLASKAWVSGGAGRAHPAEIADGLMTE